MRRFFFGVLTGLLLVVIAVGGFVLALPQSAPLPPPTTSPSVPATAPTLSRGQTWLGDITLDSSALTTTTGGLRDVHASGTGVLLTTKGLSARTLAIDAVLPFAAAASSVGSQVQLYAATGGRAGLRRTVTVLGRDLQVTATGTVRAQDGLLVIEPDTIDLGRRELAGCGHVGERAVLDHHPATGPGRAGGHAPHIGRGGSDRVRDPSPGQ